MMKIQYMIIGQFHKNILLNIVKYIGIYKNVIAGGFNDLFQV